MRERTINHKVDLAIKLYGLPFAESEAEETARRAVAHKYAHELVENQWQDGGTELKATLMFGIRSTEKYGELLCRLLYLVATQKGGLDYALESLDTFQDAVGFPEEVQVELISAVRAILESDRDESRERMDNFRQNKMSFFENPVAEIGVN